MQRSHSHASLVTSTVIANAQRSVSAFEPGGTRRRLSFAALKSQTCPQPLSPLLLLLPKALPLLLFLRLP